MDKPSCLSLSSLHSSAFLLFFLFNNPGCIFSLNQTICLLAFISSNKDSEDPEPCGSRHFPWRLQEARGRSEGPLEVTCPAGSFGAWLPVHSCVPLERLRGAWLPLLGSLFCSDITGSGSHLPAGKELVWRSWNEVTANPGSRGAEITPSRAVTTGEPGKTIRQQCSAPR